MTVANSCFYLLGKAPTYLHLKEASVYVQFIVILFALHGLLQLTSPAQSKYIVENSQLGSTSCTTASMVAVRSLKTL